MRILVTGGAGFIGKRLISMLVERHEVLSYGFHNLTIPEHPNLTRLNGNILFPNPLKQAVKDADVVVHLAAQTEVEKMRTGIKMFVTNVDGTNSVLEACRRHNVKKFIFASTGLVYGSSSLSKETDNADQVDLYPNTKRMCEIMCNHYSKYFDVAVLRIFSVYGLNQNREKVVPKLIGSIYRGRDVPVCDQSRDFVHVDDVCRGIIGAMGVEHGFGIYNIGAGRSIPVRTVANLISETLNKKPNIVNINCKSVKSTCADIKAAKLKFGYMPQIHIEKGIKGILADPGWKNAV